MSGPATAFVRYRSIAVDQRIDTLLTIDARHRLKGVVELVNSEIEKTNASLEIRGLDFA
jgi:hypothetical protein